jgi:hypothetical protein
MLATTTAHAWDNMLCRSQPCHYIFIIDQLDVEVDRSYKKDALNLLELLSLACPQQV